MTTAMALGGSVWTYVLLGLWMLVMVVVLWDRGNRGYITLWTPWLTLTVLGAVGWPPVFVFVTTAIAWALCDRRRAAVGTQA